jgi:hypothetical protein
MSQHTCEPLVPSWLDHGGDGRAHGQHPLDSGHWLTLSIMYMR